MNMFYIGKTEYLVSYEHLNTQEFNELKLTTQNTTTFMVIESRT